MGFSWVIIKQRWEKKQLIFNWKLRENKKKIKVKNIENKLYSRTWYISLISLSYGLQRDNTLIKDYMHGKFKCDQIGFAWFKAYTGLYKMSKVMHSNIYEKIKLIEICC